jgi:hypothetical protein
MWGDQAGLFDAGSVETRRQPSDLRRAATDEVRV